MGVLIKGIKMPKCCVDCPCFYDFISCQALFDGTDDFSASGFDEYKMRLPNCPLVEVPPHGRLIDADRLPHYTGYALSASEVAKAVEAAPTIIESEEDNLSTTFQSLSTTDKGEEE